MVRNGVPGNSHQEEVPGRMDVVSTLPETMTGPGEHTVAMRISSYRCGVPGDEATFRFFMNDPVKVAIWVMRNAIAPTLAAGAMFVLASVCALIWLLAARRPALLFVGSMCLWAATMQALIALRWFYNYPSDWWYPLMLAEDFAHGVFAWCFVAFVIAHFSVPHGRWILTALVPWLAYIHWINSRPPDMQNSWVIIAAYGAAIGPLLWAAWLRRPGAWPVIMGVLASAAWILNHPWLYTWNQFLSRFSPALLGVTAAIAMQVRVERREAQQTRLTATRLEIELLKKSLQPHFLMNTLTALMEVIEQDQAAAVNLIDDLAGEFRLLGSMAAEKTVPLAREIELCRTHLRLMSVRKGRECRFEVENTDDAAPVPPALFLTLIENGFSHQLLPGGPVVFKLFRSIGDGGATRYTFTSPGEVQSNGMRPPGGTGLRYVKARLEESTPGHWTFKDGAVRHGWETIVEIGPRRPKSVI